MVMKITVVRFLVKRGAKNHLFHNKLLHNSINSTWLFTYQSLQEYTEKNMDYQIFQDMKVIYGFQELMIKKVLIIMTLE